MVQRQAKEIPVSLTFSSTSSVIYLNFGVFKIFGKRGYILRSMYSHTLVSDIFLHRQINDDEDDVDD